MRFVAPMLACLMLSGCGFFERDNAYHPTATPTDELNAKADLYCSLASAAADEHGFVGEECDQMLFNSLRAIGCPTAQIDILAAEDPAEPGKFHRDAKRSCYVPGNKAASRAAAISSRDMLIGRLAWYWDQGPSALPALEREIAYLESTGWYLGGPEDAESAAVRESRLRVGSNLKATVYELRFRLGGADSKARQATQFWDPLATDFEAHLMVQHLFLRALMLGGVTDAEREYLKLQHDRQPHNALFEAVWRKFVDGDQSAATAAVVDDTPRFPSSGLPTSAGRCTDYLWQRDGDDTSDWQPCSPEEGEHSYTGTDLTFLRAVITDQVRVGSFALRDEPGAQSWPYIRNPAVR